MVADLPYTEAPPTEASPARFALITRKGEYSSYPYAYVGLIECPTPTALTIKCNCSEVSCIEVRGRGLDQVAIVLSSQRLIALTESEHPDYLGSGTVVRSIEILRKESKG
jgi:hypothetical protein